MAAPSMTAPATPGSLIAEGTSLAAGKNTGVYVDVTLKFQAQLVGEAQTGAAVAATAGVKWEARKVYGATTLSASATAGATTLSVTSATGFHQGQTVAVDSGAGAGELVTISSVSGTTLTVPATTYAHSNGAAVYLVEQTPTASVTPASSTGAIAANTNYSKALYLETARYYVSATNLDGTNAVTIALSNDTIDSVV